MSQNRSHAVMAQRAEPHDSLDFFPTPLWATRALIEHVLIGGGFRDDTLRAMTVEDPACGQGHMVRALSEYFAKAHGADVHDYGIGDVHDFLFGGPPLRKVDWIITNPPFRLAEDFIFRGLDVAKVGVAVLVRTSFIEGVGRYHGLFSKRRPTYLAPFVERVPMFKGRVDAKGSTATSYCWIVWVKEPYLSHFLETHVRWIPPCRKRLERDADYAGVP